MKDNNFNKKPMFPFTYGDIIDNDDTRLSNHLVKFLNHKKTRTYISLIFSTIFILGNYATPASAIPPEYGERANEILNQAAENAPIGDAVPPIGQIKGQVPMPQKNEYILPAMPIEQQRLIAAQQSGRLKPGQPLVQQEGVFYLPPKPQRVGPRVANTVMFGTSVTVICVNALWGQPVAIFMCSSGLAAITLSIGKEVAVFVFKKLL